MAWTLLPIVGVGLSVVAWGSFTAPMKCKTVVAAALDPVVFQLYMCVGIAAASALPLAVPQIWEARAWTWYAVVSAGFWVPASILSVYCVRDVGIALGQGVWSGIVALTSFLWGQLVFNRTMRDPALGGFGIALLVCGIAALGFISGGDPQHDAADLDAPLVDTAASVQEAVVPIPGAAPTAERPRRRVRGLVLALCVGLLAGSTMVPLELSPTVPFHDPDHGLNSLTFAVCFGVSSAGVALAIFLLHVLGRRLCGKPAPRMEWRTCALPALLSGGLWAVGNLGCVLAVLPPLGLTVGYPLSQARSDSARAKRPRPAPRPSRPPRLPPRARERERPPVEHLLSAIRVTAQGCLIVSGIWGIVYYKEVPLTHGPVITSRLAQ